MSSEKFCLRWNDFETNINEAFRDLRDSKDFLDVTLVCEDEQIQAHKVILSACSSFFHSILRRNTHQHPLIYMKGIKFSDLQSVLSFMYQGEVSVAQEDLNSFLFVAEDLRVKGLTQNQQSKRNVMESTTKRNISKLHSASSQPGLQGEQKKQMLSKNPLAEGDTTNHSEDDEIEEVMPVKTEPEDSPMPAQDTFTPGHASHALTTTDDATEYQDEDYAEFPQYQHTLQDMQNSSCTRNHVESNHFPDIFSYPCDQCELVFTTKTNFNMHRSRKHKPDRKLV